MRHEEAVARLPELVGLRAAEEDHQGLEAHVAGCPECRRRLESLQATDARLRALEPPPAPSAALERRVLAIPALAGPEPRRAPSWRRAAVAAGIAAVLAGAALGAVALRDGPGPAPAFERERVIPLAADRHPGVSARAEIGIPRGDRLPIRLVASGLSHGGGRYYGLWLAGRDGAVSGGSFRPDGKGRCVVILHAPAGRWTTLAITLDDRPPTPATTVADAPL